MYLPGVSVRVLMNRPSTQPSSPPAPSQKPTCRYSKSGRLCPKAALRILRFGENLPSETDEAQQCSHSETVAMHNRSRRSATSQLGAAITLTDKLRYVVRDRRIMTEHVTHHHRRAREPDNPRAGLRLAPRRSRSAPRLALLTSHASHHRSCRALRLGGPASDGRNVALSSAAFKASAVTHRLASPLAAVALPAGSSPVGRH
jgi:hypothetical protein